ncbi:MAG: hypothetical protein Q7K43_01450 [Candidatus Woesearchaeota archaeon]|nr:hypothetical protein [Candidatus Woesearchaeota archaeon]
MEYTQEQIKKIVEDNDGELTLELVRDLEQRIKEKGFQEGVFSILFPPIEINGRIKRFELGSLNYVFLSAEQEKWYSEQLQKKLQNREEKRKNEEYLNSPGGKKRMEEENKAFWNKFSINAAYICLIQDLHASSDPRAKTLINIDRLAREKFAECASYSPCSIDAQIAGARAVFDYAECNCSVLYNKLQKHSKWFNSGGSC